MKNKDYQKTIIFFLIITIVFLAILLIINYNSLKKYEYNNNIVISKIVSAIKIKYPELDDNQIISILNEDNLKPDTTLKKYGIDLTKDSISITNQNLIKKTLKINIILLIFYVLIIISIISFFNYKENQKIKKITNYIKEINNQNYELDILSNSEEDLSLLKNEIYKTAVTLNEQANLLLNDKNTLKNSLSDISHQLKTPLTSITLMIDTIQDNKVDEKRKKELLINIKHKIANINFLVHTLLKLSKFDANTITFNDKFYKIEDILKEVEDNLSPLIDLKNINISIKGNKKDKIFCDFKWQVEALNNIIKNCIEYSEDNAQIDISYTSNDLFSKVEIKDYGKGMDKEDVKHIFKRFCKGKNSSSDSVGIGLSLAKSIIEKDNGYITVNSKLGEGTTFTIKYLK